jgi:hypothetical protein
LKGVDNRGVYIKCKLEGTMAKKRRGDSYYQPVKGSRELATRGLSDDELEGIEDPSFLKSRKPYRVYAGERLGKAETRTGEGAFNVPFDTFDSLASRLTPLEQAVYYQFLRLSLGEGKNFSRVGKRELTARTGISERRLLVALDGLVRKERIKPLHRNNSGTLYRVFMEGEEPATGPKGQSLTAKTSRVSRRAPELEGTTYYDDSPNNVARASGGAIKRKGAMARSKPSPRPRSRPLESPLNEERFAGVSGARSPGISVGKIVKEFFRAQNRNPTSEEEDGATSEITSLLEDGYSREEVLAAVRWFSTHFPKEGSLARLPYYIHEALSAKG